MTGVRATRRQQRQQKDLDLASAFSCTVCGAKFRTLQALGGHKSAHNGKRKALTSAATSAAPGTGGSPASSSPAPQSPSNRILAVNACAMPWGTLHDTTPVDLSRGTTTSAVGEQLSAFSASPNGIALALLWAGKQRLRDMGRSESPAPSPGIPQTRPRQPPASPPVSEPAPLRDSLSAIPDLSLGPSGSSAKALATQSVYDGSAFIRQTAQETATSPLVGRRELGLYEREHRDISPSPELASLSPLSAHQMLMLRAETPDLSTSCPARSLGPHGVPQVFPAAPGSRSLSTPENHRQKRHKASAASYSLYPPHSLLSCGQALEGQGSFVSSAARLMFAVEQNMETARTASPLLAAMSKSSKNSQEKARLAEASQASIMCKETTCRLAAKGFQDNDEDVRPCEESSNSRQIDLTLRLGLCI